MIAVESGRRYALIKVLQIGVYSPSETGLLQEFEFVDRTEERVRKRILILSNNDS